MQVESTGSRPVTGTATYQRVPSRQNRNLQPFSGSASEIRIYNKFQQYIDRPQDHLPSVLAKLKDDVVHSSPTIQMINQIFNTAIEEYRATFTAAYAKDLDQMQRPPARDEINDFREAVAKGVERTTHQIPNVIIIRNIGALIFSMVGACHGMANQASYTQEKINLENSQNRQKWLNEVKFLEERRKNTTIRLISERVVILSTNINENSDTVDTSWIVELQGLDLLNQHLNPSKPLLIGQKTIKEYVVRMNSDSAETKESESQELAIKSVRTLKQSKTPTQSVQPAQGVQTVIKPKRIPHQSNRKSPITNKI